MTAPSASSFQRIDAERSATPVSSLSRGELGKVFIHVMME